jgi:hypothetical protein
LIYYGIKGLLPYYEVRKWVKGSAEICSLKELYEMVKDGQYSETKYYYPLVEYAYNYKGIKYLNNCVSFEKQNIWTSGLNGWGDKLPETNKPWHSWIINESVAVYINPELPQQSVLLPFLTKKRKSHHLALIFGGVLIFGLWLLLWYHNMVIA